MPYLSYVPDDFALSLRFAGGGIYSAGRLQIDAEGNLESEAETDLKGGVYRKIVFEDDRIAGCILLGDIRAQRKILQAIERGTRLGGLKGGLLKDPDALARL